MTEEKNLDGAIVYKCMKCGFLYAKKKDAVDCENWCRKNRSCNLDIVKRAIKV